MQFDVQGGTPEIATQNLPTPAGGKVTKPTEPTKDGFTFGGWYLNSAGTGTAFNFNTVVKSDLTLYAKWVQNA